MSENQYFDALDSAFESFGEADQATPPTLGVHKNTIASTRLNAGQTLNHLERSFVKDPASQALRISSALTQYGTSSIRQPVNPPENVCICIQENHGALEFMREKSSVELQSWFQIQQQSIAIQEQLMQEVGKDNVVFFLEGFMDNYRAELVGNDFLMAMDTLFTKASQNPWEATQAIRRLYAMPESLQLNIFNLMTGMYRFAIKKLAFKELRADQVYGFSYAGREAGRSQKINAPTASEFFSLQSEDFASLHEELLTKIRTKLGKGKVGIVLLGGAHFATDKNMQEASKFGNAHELQRRKDVSVEAYLAKLDSTVTMTLEPRVL